MPVKSWRNAKDTATRKPSVEEEASNTIVKLGEAHQIPRTTRKLTRADQDEQAQAYPREEKRNDHDQQNDELQNDMYFEAREKPKQASVARTRDCSYHVATPSTPASPSVVSGRGCSHITLG